MNVFFEVFARDVLVDTQVREYDGGNKVTKHNQVAYLHGLSMFPVKITLNLPEPIAYPAGKYETHDDFFSTGDFGKPNFNMKVSLIPISNKS